MTKILNFIGGEFVPPRNGKFLENINPALGKAYSLIPSSTKEDVESAVASGQKAFPQWAATPREERSRILRLMGQKIAERLPELARAESIDNGKPIALATNLDIPRSQSNFDFFADAITQFHNETYWTDSKAVNMTHHRPLGVVACISPWNLPLYLLTWKLAPALAMGNTVVAKPSEVTPMTAFLLCQIAKDAGLPSGVLNMVHGTGPEVGERLCVHPAVQAISFTGSTATGRRIAQSVAGTFKKISLEMGGKNPNLIFADANFDQALATTVRSSFLNQGQICLCGSRVFVERPIYEKFKKALVEKAKALKQGDPLDPQTEQGALVSAEHLQKVLNCIETAKKEGGKILTGGKRAQMTGAHSEGYFVEPTIIEDLPETCAGHQEEIFGPVITLTAFDSEDEVLKMANSTKYGLAASLWTQDISRAHRVAQQLESGIVWVNTWMLRDLRTPFGGVKESGVGREGGAEALKFFSEVKNICIGLDEGKK